RVGVDHVGADFDERLQVLGHEGEPGIAGGDGVQERLPGVRFQVAVQRPAAVRVDVDPIPLEPVGTGGAALVHGDRDAGAAQALREAQPADATANDQYARSHANHYHSFAWHSQSTV